MLYNSLLLSIAVLYQIGINGQAVHHKDQMIPKQPGGLDNENIPPIVNILPAKSQENNALPSLPPLPDMNGVPLQNIIASPTPIITSPAANVASKTPSIVGQIIPGNIPIATKGTLSSTVWNYNPTGLTNLSNPTPPKVPNGAQSWYSSLNEVNTPNAKPSASPIPTPSNNQSLSGPTQTASNAQSISSGRNVSLRISTMSSGALSVGSLQSVCIISFVTTLALLGLSQSLFFY